jgi:hypothetical protein
MIGRNKHGNPRASLRVRLAVAAAVLVGGGAAGVVAIAASHGSATAAESAGYTTSYQHQLSEPAALSSAMNGWSESPSRSLQTLSQMPPVHNSWSAPWHHVTLAVQRGIVIAANRKEIVVKSADNEIEVWWLSRGTKILNVGGSKTGMNAMTGGTMQVHWRLDTGTRGLAQGDAVFVFGERQNHTLKAQLVLFAAPLKVRPQFVPAATATPSMTATPGMNARPAAPAPAAPAPAGSAPAFTGNNS